jgi:hypothetical protein
MSQLPGKDKRAMTNPGETVDAKLRAEIVSEIMKLVGPRMVPMERKPTIDELEKILNSDNPQQISIAPDGTMLVAHGHTVGDIADAVLRVITRLRTLAPVLGKCFECDEQLFVFCPKCNVKNLAPVVTEEMLHAFIRASQGGILVKGAEYKRERGWLEAALEAALPLAPVTEEMVETGAAAIANARGARRGAPAVSNILAMLKHIKGGKLYDELMEDSRAALEAAFPVAKTTSPDGER